jgi:LmbE family N-acetylglucosaminyl deacetylase
MPHCRLLMLRLLRWVLRWRARPLLLPPGPILIIAPHPDDETLGCGGLIMRERQAGRRVHLAFLTDGSQSHRSHPLLTPTALAKLRHAEAIEAAACLGVPADELTFIDLPDGELPRLAPSEREQAVDALSALLCRLQPAVMLVAYRRDGSSEHEAAFPLVTAVLQQARLRPLLIEYLVWACYSPRLFLRALFFAGQVHCLTFLGQGATKTKALACYRSQFQPTPPWTQAVVPPQFTNAFSPEEEFFLKIRS